MKAKKSAVWQDRLAKQGEQQQAKQQKRQGNIDSRIQAKKDKKKQKVGRRAHPAYGAQQGGRQREDGGTAQAGVLCGGTGGGAAVCACLSRCLHYLCPASPHPPPASFSCLFVQRENKLLRAGFEGRKQGFIDTPKRAAAPAAAGK